MQRTFSGPRAEVCPQPSTHAAVVAVAIIMLPVCAGAQVVINEFLPDPAGSDGGHEFVELLNTGPESVDLGGWQLQFANGAEGAVWQSRWTGTAGQSIAGNGRFLIVDRNWLGEAVGDAEAALALQNGPDAIRLVEAGVLHDLVGYGALTDTLLMETAPVPVTPGRSLARRPDGRDTGDNRADFVAAEPSPGAANFALRLLTLVESRLEPPCLAAAGEPVAVAVTLRNEGLESLPMARLLLTCDIDTVAATLDAMTAGEERRLEWTVRPSRPGRRPLRLLLPLPATSDTLRVLLGDYLVGTADLVLNEALAAPRSGQGEWIEVVAPGPAACDLGRYRLRDEDGDWVRLRPLVLQPGERAVVVQDSLGFSGWLAANADGPGDARGCGAVVLPLSPWPSLNNSSPESRTFADRVQLADTSGTVIDQVVLGGAGEDPVGDRSLERIGAAAAGWAGSLAAAGSTPGCANSVSDPFGDGRPESALEALPAAVDRTNGDAAIHLRFAVPEGVGGWDLTVFDLDGRQVRDLGGDGRGAGPRSLFWDLKGDDGRAVAAGGYVASLRLRPGAAGAPAPSRLLLVVR